MAEARENERARWLDDTSNVRKVYVWLWGTCLALLVGGEALLIFARSHADDHAGSHAGFAFESWPGFYSLFGFVACVSLVIAAKELRKLLMHGEDYYEPAQEPEPAAQEERDGH
jgi:hypothetical protein